MRSAPAHGVLLPIAQCVGVHSTPADFLHRTGLPYAMPVMPGALWCSATARPPIHGIEVIDALELENPPSGRVLLIDLPFGTVEEPWLGAVRTLARQPRMYPRRFVALGLLGNIKLLGLEEVVALRA